MCNLISLLSHICPVYVRSHLGTAVRVVEVARVLCVACDGLLLVWGTTEHRYWFCSVSQQPFLSPFTETDFTLLWRFFEAHPKVYLLIWKTVNVSELIHLFYFFFSFSSDISSNDDNISLEALLSLIFHLPAFVSGLGGRQHCALASSDAEICCSSVNAQAQVWETQCQTTLSGFLSFFTTVFLKSCAPNKAAVCVRGT